MFPTPHLRLPTTGQALRQSLERRDSVVLSRLTAQLRVLGCRIPPEELARQLLTHGSARVRDAFGQELLLEVSVPPCVPRQRPDEALGFRLSC
ncbi:hypothetical protein [Ideonella livida]|uniref:Uncharacterized protein n=1 Tax=Ideonella livida TaxID=2707176 RepID=A0A7C9PFV5_9BURK|nr:hypothetical protein [Ideonella livida]NDY90873.1 hypothetical protein [Ideonella livida]